MTPKSISTGLKGFVIREIKPDQAGLPRRWWSRTKPDFGFLVDYSEENTDNSAEIAEFRTCLAIPNTVETRYSYRVQRKTCQIWKCLRSWSSISVRCMPDKTRISSDRTIKLATHEAVGDLKTFTFPSRVKRMENVMDQQSWHYHACQASTSYDHCWDIEIKYRSVFMYSRTSL